MLQLKPDPAINGRVEPRAPSPLASADAGLYRILVYGQESFQALDWPRAGDDAVLDSYVYQSREFLSVWLSTMGSARQARAWFVVVEDRNGEPAMWLPFVVEREYGCTFLRFPDGGMADYNGPALRQGDEFAVNFPSVWAAILACLPGIDVIDFEKMPETIWHRPNPMLQIGTATPKDEGFYLPIAGTFEGYLADPTRKPRAKKLRQLYRKLERTGPLKVGEVRDPAVVAEGRAFLERHKTVQYLRTLGFSQFDKPGVRAFVDRLCSPDALASFTRLTAMTFNGAVIGAQLDFVTPRRQQGFMTTFDADNFGFFSPGRQVQLHLIERAFTDELRVFDLGHGDNPYKHPWMTEVLQLYSFAQARTMRGRLYLAARSLRRRLPKGIGRRLKALMQPQRGAPPATEPDA
jgi:CelD/BcsL family acetyltransferase involved in cellulose biosynthesis